MELSSHNHTGAEVTPWHLWLLLRLTAAVSATITISLTREDTLSAGSLHLTK